MTKRRAIVYLAWGNDSILELIESIKRSVAIKNYKKVLLTDEKTYENCITKNYGKLSSIFHQIIPHKFVSNGLLRKSELIKIVPKQFDSFLYLDTDAIVLRDVSLGFQKAEAHSIALSPAPHYSLDYFWGFSRVMEYEGIPCEGQMQYNTGVIFFTLDEYTKVVFDKWNSLCSRYGNMLPNDQPFLSLAMEEEGFNPYTLSINYNYRGFGDNISGFVRIWHNRGKVPKDLNVDPGVWPPRRAFSGKVER